MIRILIKFIKQFKSSVNIYIFAAIKLNTTTMNQTEEANQESHYILLVVAIIIGLTGVYLRFADFRYNNIVANIILIVGVAIALKAIFAILK